MKPQTTAKIDRSAFLYFEGGKDFAQCGSCASRNPAGGLCSSLAVIVQSGWSCGLYLPGTFDEAKAAKRMTPEEAGLVKRQVRCEHCAFGGSEECALFAQLNAQMPAAFWLSPNHVELPLR